MIHQAVALERVSPDLEVAYVAVAEELGEGLKLKRWQIKNLFADPNESIFVGDDGAICRITVHKDNLRVIVKWLLPASATWKEKAPVLARTMLDVAERHPVTLNFEVGGNPKTVAEARAYARYFPGLKVEKRRRNGKPQLPYISLEHFREAVEIVKQWP